MTGSTAPVPNARTTGERAGHVTAAARQRFAAAWARELLGTSYVPMTGAEVEGHLRGCTEQLVDALLSEPFDPSPARHVGADLVAVHFTGAESLGRTTSLGHERMLELLGLDESWRSRAARLQGELSAGFVQAVRKRILDEQESIRQAVLDARDAVEQALRSSEARFRAIFSGAAIGIGIGDTAGRVLEVNESLTRILGRSSEQLRRMTVQDLFHPADHDDVRRFFAELARGERDQYRVEKRFTRPDGARVWTEMIVSLVRDEQGLPLYHVAMIEDVTDRKLLQERLEHQATHDPLTGLPNRALFLERLEAVLRGRGADERVALCYMDLDGFKVINDSLGHHLGDDLLLAVGERLGDRVSGPGRLVARIGGDEFVILVEQSCSTTAAVEVAERALGSLSEPFRVGEHELSVSASVGVVERPVRGQTAAELIRDADVTLYWAKSAGKNQWAVFDAERNAAEVAQFQLSATMPAALEREEFYVDYQPLVSLDEFRVVGVEALVRWQHPDLGRLGPDKFIGLAEETGLIVALGRWVLRESCRQAKRWQDEHGELAPLVSVNLAVRQSRDPDLVGDVARILDETGLSPHRLQLEVTESAVMGTADQSLQALRELADMGVRIAIDDFGTGYSNLAYLRHLPVHDLKVAGSFMEGLREAEHPDPVDARIVGGLVNLAHALDLTVTAEGVETHAQARRLADIGCETGQGYFFAKPCSPEKIDAFIDDHLR